MNPSKINDIISKSENKNFQENKSNNKSNKILFNKKIEKYPLNLDINYVNLYNLSSPIFQKNSLFPNEIPNLTQYNSEIKRKSLKNTIYGFNDYFPDLIDKEDLILSKGKRFEELEETLLIKINNLKQKYINKNNLISPERKFIKTHQTLTENGEITKFKEKFGKLNDKKYSISKKKNNLNKFQIYKESELNLQNYNINLKTQNSDLEKDKSNNNFTNFNEISFIDKNCNKRKIFSALEKNNKNLEYNNFSKNTDELEKNSIDYSYNINSNINKKKKIFKKITDSDNNEIEPKDYLNLNTDNENSLIKNNNNHKKLQSLVLEDIKKILNFKNKPENNKELRINSESVKKELSSEHEENNLILKINYCKNDKLNLIQIGNEKTILENEEMNNHVYSYFPKRKIYKLENFNNKKLGVFDNKKNIIKNNTNEKSKNIIKNFDKSLNKKFFKFNNELNKKNFNSLERLSKNNIIVNKNLTETNFFTELSQKKINSNQNMKNNFKSNLKFSEMNINNIKLVENLEEDNHINFIDRGNFLNNQVNNIQTQNNNQEINNNCLDKLRNSNYFEENKINNFNLFEKNPLFTNSNLKNLNRDNLKIKEKEKIIDFNIYQIKSNRKFFLKTLRESNSKIIKESNFNFALNNISYNNFKSVSNLNYPFLSPKNNKEFKKFKMLEKTFKKSIYI